MRGSSNTQLNRADVADATTLALPAKPPKARGLSPRAGITRQLAGAAATLPSSAPGGTATTLSDPRLDETGTPRYWVPGRDPSEAGECARNGSTPAFSDASGRLAWAVLDAAAGEGLWLGRICGGLVALLAFLDREPGWARALILEHEDRALAAASRWTQSVLGEVLDAGRGQVIVGSQLTPPTSLIAELLCTALLSVIRPRILVRDGRPLVELAPSLMEHVVEPYLGAGAQIADRSHDPSLPPLASREARILPVRAHPRVLLALRVIAASPGLTTRKVELELRERRQRGGELSQVLNPLRQRGLIENGRAAAESREGNAWTLTRYGHRALELLNDSIGDTRRAA